MVSLAEVVRLQVMFRLYHDGDSLCIRFLSDNIDVRVPPAKV